MDGGMDGMRDGCRSNCVDKWRKDINRDLVYVSQNGDNKLCLICHEDIWRNGGGVQELRCMQRFHKEVKRVFIPRSFLFGACHGAWFIFEDILLKLGRLTQRKPWICCSEDSMLNDSDVSVLWVLKVVRRLERCRPRRGSEAAAFQMGRLSDERRKSADGNISVEKELHTPRRQSSLRRHRWYQILRVSN